jgi:hypothetical protein
VQATGNHGRHVLPSAGGVWCAKGRAGVSDGRCLDAPQWSIADHAGAQDPREVRAEVAPQDDELLARHCASANLLGRSFSADRPKQKRL